MDHAIANLDLILFLAAFVIVGFLLPIGGK